MLVDQASASAPKQVIVSVKLMEVNQKNFDEFSDGHRHRCRECPRIRSRLRFGGAAAPAISPCPGSIRRPAACGPPETFWDSPALILCSPTDRTLQLSTPLHRRPSNSSGRSQTRSFKLMVTAISQKKGHRSHLRPLRDHEERSENGDRDGARVSVSDRVRPAGDSAERQFPGEPSTLTDRKATTSLSQALHPSPPRHRPRLKCARSDPCSKSRRWSARTAVRWN